MNAAVNAAGDEYPRRVATSVTVDDGSIRRPASSRARDRQAAVATPGASLAHIQTVGAKAFAVTTAPQRPDAEDEDGDRNGGGERGEQWVELALAGEDGLLSAGGGPAKSPVPVEGDVPFRYATVVD